MGMAKGGMGSVTPSLAIREAQLAAQQLPPQTQLEYSGIKMVVGASARHLLTLPVTAAP